MVSKGSTVEFVVGDSDNVMVVQDLILRPDKLRPNPRSVVIEPVLYSEHLVQRWAVQDEERDLLYLYLLTILQESAFGC